MPGHLTVGQIAGWLAEAYPPGLAESWDRVGLAVGDPQARVDGVVLAVDLTDEVIDEARDAGAQLILTHHPLLLRGVHALRRDQPKGRLVMALVEAGIALVSMHTNADSAVDGVSDALAATLGLAEVRPLAPAASDPLDKIVTFVPADHADAVLDALAEAGAGTIGDYDRCAWRTDGTGQFRPLAAANPFLGAVGEIERTPEERLEMVLPRARRADVVRALRAAHPYEEPAFDVIELAGWDAEVGLGRIGRLAQPLAARDVAATLADALPPTATGVRLGGDPDRSVTTVALLAGAGDSMLDAVRATDADLYVTSDLRHHPAQEFLQWADAPALVDIPHWAAEWLWLPVAERLLLGRAEADQRSLHTRVSHFNTDPWRLRLGSAD